MSKPSYETVEGKAPDLPEPPRYSEVDSLRHPEPLAPIGYGAALPEPSQGQPPYGAPGTGFKQGPSILPPQAVFITPVQPTQEPDYLAYSIFTMFCCFFPLGITALVFSILTREANFAGNLTAAQRNSRLARIMAHAAVGVGLCFLILYITLVIFLTLK
ncbi:synapse differentiation-inducing gene protein 1-like [Varanus komodoensis]|uniref:synapse differentiation-inducing gene protein 1-like n=1 Tax=Varanus komodoensis TaxID=61221 RepID=UPI001CF76F78|nr:synapse differentiation-inducing gene protein 1-like [Varanus komodoensis]